MNLDIKTVFHNESNYNSITLVESTIYELLVCIYYEITNYEKHDELTKELNFINNFINFYKKFNTYSFCKNTLESKFDIFNTDIIHSLLKDSNLLDLFKSLYDKINITIENLIGNCDYNPNRVKINDKTSVILIAYTSDLKKIWELFNKDFIDKIENYVGINNIQNEIYRGKYFKKNLQLVPTENLKGAWASRSINLK
jgi:hypothetical protein